MYLNKIYPIIRPKLFIIGANVTENDKIKNEFFPIIFIFIYTYCVCVCVCVCICI